MMKFPELKISQKLPLIVVGAGLLTALGVGIASYFSAASSLSTATNERFVAALNDRKASFETYLGSIEQDLRFMSTNPLVRDAVTQFSQGWRILNNNQRQTLQDLYITSNPNPTGEKHLLDGASDGSYYTILHKRYHPWMRTFLTERGYYDIFLFNTSGDLIYTVFKELDYATNLQNGEYADTDLGAVFRAAMAAPEGSAFTFTDFRPYAPSHGAPASFIASPVFDDAGTRIGVIAFQMPIDVINTLMQQAAGLGETGEILLVGDNQLMRADSRLSEESTLLKVAVESPVLANIFAGSDSEFEVGSTSHVGHEAQTYGTAIEFYGVRWALLAQVAVDEVNAALVSLRNLVAAITLVLIGIISVAGYVLARQLTRPISATTKSMKVLADGDTEIDLIGTERSDEIGEMARAVEIFRTNAIERIRLEAAQQ